LAKTDRTSFNEKIKEQHNEKVTKVNDGFSNDTVFANAGANIAGC
jgi:hypothetical protein